MPRRLLWMLFLVIAVVARGAGVVRADLRSGIDALAEDASDRSAGSPRAVQNADDIAAQLARITRQPVWRQPFLLTLPVVDTCTATDRTPGTQNPRVAIAPLLPSGGQPAAIPQSQSTAELLYVGRGSLEELRGKNLAHRFVAMDVASEPLAWQTAASLGASAIIFLGDGRSSTRELLDQSTGLPVGIARFYCDDPVAVARMKSGAIKSLAIDVHVHWREKRLENLVCMIPGRLGRGQYIVLQARYDGSSQVMTRAPAASQAASPAALLDLAAKIAGPEDHATVLLVFTAGDAWNFRGTRAALDVLDPEFKDAAGAVADLKKQAAATESRLDAASVILAGIQKIADGNLAPLAISEVRTALEDQLLRESSAVEDRLEQARAAAPQNQAALNALQSQKDDLLRATAALTPGPRRSAAQILQLQSSARAILPRWQTQAVRLAAERGVDDAAPPIRAAIGERTPMFFVSLSLTPGSAQYGFFARSFYCDVLDLAGRAFAQSIRRYAPDSPQLPGNSPAFVPESTEKRFTLESFFPIPVAFSSDAALARGIAAGALATVRDASGLLDTPNDTLDRVDFPNLQRQEQSLFELLLGNAGGPDPHSRGILTDPGFYIRSELTNITADQPVTLFERAAGETLPRLTAANCLIGGEGEMDGRALGPPLAGTRRQDWYLTDANGAVTFTSRLRPALTRLFAFDFDAGGMPARTLSGSQDEVRGLASDFSPDPSRPIRCMLFDSRRLDCYGLFDPRYLDTLDGIEVLDARRLDRAQNANVHVQGGAAVVFMPRDVRWQLLISRGAFNNRMLLINADADHPSGTGFDTTDLAALGPLPWRNVMDLSALNRKRQEDLEKFGIASEMISGMQASAEKQVKAAAAAEKARDYPAFFADTSAAWSLQSQVYQNLIDTSNGIIKGVIFLLLGIIPFSYFLERLVIGSTTIYRQITGFVVIFALMTLALWFHPAFRISSAPLMILLAFLILILSSAVVYILWGKFEEEIARLRGAGPRGIAHSTSLRRGAVLGAAVRLGLSNMRRRGTRTALTLFTLILLTFTLLCFTSVTESVQITPRVIAFPANMPAPPAGILIRRRGWQALPVQALAFAGGLALPRSGAIAPRWWFSSQIPEEPWIVPVTRVAGAGAPSAAAQPPGTADSFNATALLGLDPAEARFQAVPLDMILPRFSKLAAGAEICWLPEESRNTAGFSTGDVVDILGHRLTIAGFYDDAAFRKLRELTGDPMSPIDPTGTSNGAVSDDSRQLAASPEAAYRYLSAGSIAIVPASLVKSIGGRLTSIMIPPPGTGDPSPSSNPSIAPAASRSAPAQGSPVFEAAEDLARRSAFTIYASDGQSVRSINAAQSSEPKDFSAVLIPMLIAGMIIFNTMLGAVAERTREIHVYTSIGLAPAHVGMLFLAEAAALGTIGVVSGYIFGQGLATVLSWSHILPGVDLNYSSLSAIVTMGLVLAIVMLSALWPARAAARLAAPSLDRRWKLPKPIGDVLYVSLPFTVNETAARGILAFLEEFFTTTTQTGGRFTADFIKPVLTHAEPPIPPTRGLTARIWLTPYDLGVIQTIHLSILPTDQPAIFDVHLELTREAGNPTTWRRLNRPFLVEIRKQFLLWRNLTPEQTASYLAKSESLFKPNP